jgi:hypothetical protein
MRDAFAVPFFVSVGMLFDPAFVAREPMMVAAGRCASRGYPAAFGRSRAVGARGAGAESFAGSNRARQVRARYLCERETLEQAGATTTVFEEGEAGIDIARQVMRGRNVDEATIEKMLQALRRMWIMQE